MSITANIVKEWTKIVIDPSRDWEYRHLIESTNSGNVIRSLSAP